MLKGALSTICRGPAGFFEAHPGTLVAPPSIPDLYDWRQAWSFSHFQMEIINLVEKWEHSAKANFALTTHWHKSIFQLLFISGAK
ncbi:MAG: hypothetical protein OEW45_18625 [Deltaproteobacteria bacterium]|nr:hypothetical protein [Deltaproteobacteria bacterium]